MIIVTPYDPGKDLGKAYNRIMALIPEGEHACLMDIDAMFLTARQPGIIMDYIEKYPDAVLTCYTNRISPLSKQLYNRQVNENDSIKVHIANAVKMQLQPMSVRKIGNMISGFLMVVPKSVWNIVKFAEGMGCLGVDTKFSKHLHINRIPILLMENIYLWHTYRIENNIFYKEHLRA